MTDTITQAKPALDNQYWYSYSKGLVEGAVEARDKAAQAIEKLVLWLWSIYVAGTSVGLILASKDLSFWNTFLIAIASVSLIGVYWSSVWVQMPVMYRFDSRSPGDIREAYNVTVKTKNDRLHITLFLALLAGALVAVSLIVASVAKGKPEAEPFVAPNLSASIIQRNGEVFLSVNVAAGKAKSVDVYVKPLTPNGTGQTAPLKPYVFLPTESGFVQASIPIDSRTRQVLVRAVWEDANKIQIQLSRTVSAEPAKK